MITYVALALLIGAPVAAPLAVALLAARRRGRRPAPPAGCNLCDGGWRYRDGSPEPCFACNRGGLGNASRGAG